MAWLQQDPSGNYHVSFRFGGRKFKRSLKTKRQRIADSKKLRLEENIALVTSGRLELPNGIDVPTFLLSDGKLKGSIAIQRVPLREIFEAFFSTLPENAVEPGTLKMMQIHRRHLERILGPRFDLGQLGFLDLQKYVNSRSKERGTRGRTVSASTVKKELTTLRGVFSWAVTSGSLSEDSIFPSKGLRYGKSSELPPFQTFSDVVAQTSGLEPDSDKAKELWSSVFLNQDEVTELLEFVEDNARHPFLYPMFVFAAHTGARRSEILRAQVSDFREGLLTIRERKRRKRMNSTRQVPVSARLEAALTLWLAEKPDGPHLICNTDVLSMHELGSAVSIDQSNSYFRKTLKGSRFQYLRGWHAFRHSFCSNCAAKGVDQRVIDSWVGHTTEDMRRRYRHLFPNTQHDTLRSVFS